MNAETSEEKEARKKAISRAANKRWRDKNKPEIAAYHREYRVKNKSKFAAYQKKWLARGTPGHPGNHLDRISLGKRKRYAENIEEERLKAREKFWKNRDAILARQRSAYARRQLADCFVNRG